MFKVQKIKFVTLSIALMVMMGNLFANPAKATDWDTCSIAWFKYQGGELDKLTGSAPGIVKDSHGFGSASGSPECQGLINTEIFYLDHYDSTMLESVAHAGKQFNFGISGNYLGSNANCEIEVFLNGVMWISGSTHFEPGEPDAQSWYLPDLTSDQNNLFDLLTSIGDNEFKVTSNCPGYEEANITLSANVKIVQDSFNEFEGVSINDGAEFSNTPSVNVNLSFDTGVIGQVMISNDGGFPSSQREIVTYSQNSIPWTLNTSRDERMVKTIYVKYKLLNRYTGALESTWSQTLSDDIILDTTEPVIESISATEQVNAAANLVAARSLSSTKLVDISLNATDNKSGVSEVQYSAMEGTSGSITKSYSKFFSASFGSDVSTIYVRVNDKAGNWSSWRSLPLIDSAAASAAADLASRTIKNKKKYSAKSLAKQVGVPFVSPKAKVTFKVAKSSKKICTKSGLKLKTLKSGTCVVTFTVQEPKPKKGKKPKATKTVKTLIVK